MTLPPVFMFGFERSGTTLLSMMVGAHPQIAVPLSVTGLWFHYADRLDEFGRLATDSDLGRIVDALLQEERVRLWDAELDRAELLAGLEPGSYASVVRRFHELYAQVKGKPYWANLDIATLDRMDTAYRWFPNARFVHIVRDGRDVALSHETMPYGASNTAECAERWMHRLTVSLKMGAILGEEQYTVVRYEDLVLDSRRTLARLCEFIGVAYSEQMLAYQSMVDDKVPADKRWLWPALDKPPMAAKAYAWKQKMSRAKRLVFEDAAAQTLRALGYETYDRVPKSLGRYFYELWCFLGRGGRFRRLAAAVGLRRRSVLEREADQGG